MSVSLISSGYSGGINQVVDDFGVSEEVAVLGMSLFVIGFAFGPFLWAPLGEMYGRQVIYCVTLLFPVECTNDVAFFLLSSGDRWTPFDPERNYPDLGSLFGHRENSPQMKYDKAREELMDLSWSAVLKRTFEAYVRGEQPNMYGEWIRW